MYHIKKTIKMKKIVLFALLCSLCYGCATEEEILPAETAAPQEYAIVSLGMGGEITSEEQPLPTRAETSSRDLYGVQVFRGSNSYAYGLFDNADSMRIALLKGSSYKFICTLVKNGKDLLRRDVNWSYSRPFSSVCRNQFVYSTSNYGTYLGSGTAILTDGTTVQYPQMDRYYGELDNYTPTINGTIALPMKRTAFGIKYEITDVPDGTVDVTCSNSTRTLYSASGLGANSETVGALITFNDVRGVWQYTGDYTESVTVSVSWAREIGITQSLGSKSVTIKRNAMNVIRISLSSSDNGDASFGITPEDTPMGEEGVEVPLK
jgi:hypothetical protein